MAAHVLKNAVTYGRQVTIDMVSQGQHVNSARGTVPRQRMRQQMPVGWIPTGTKIPESYLTYQCDAYLKWSGVTIFGEEYLSGLVEGVGVPAES